MGIAARLRGLDDRVLGPGSRPLLGRCAAPEPVTFGVPWLAAGALSVVFHRAAPFRRGIAPSQADLT